MGYGIIDGGATRTLASVHALEAMVNENLRRHQDGRVLRATSHFLDQGDIVGVVSDCCFGCRGETGTKGENNTQTYTCTRQLSSRHEDQECELVRASRSELSSSFREHADHPESQEGRAHRGNIRALREEPPAKWGVTELRVRLEELEEEHGIVRQTGRSRTDLQEWTVKLNKAGPKKSVLVEFCQKELLIPLSGNETIPQLNKKAMDRIYHLPDCRAEWAGPDRVRQVRKPPTRK